MAEENKENWCVVKDEQEKYYRVRIRKLTPKECFRLMGVDDEDSDKIAGVVSKSQQYKMAGNSIVVDQMLYLFESVFFPEEAMKRNLVNMARNTSDLSMDKVSAMYDAMLSIMNGTVSASHKETPVSDSKKENSPQTTETSRPRYIEADMFSGF